VADADRRRRRIRQHHRHEEGADAVGAFLVEGIDPVDDRRESAHAAAEDDAGAVGIRPAPLSNPASASACAEAASANWVTRSRRRASLRPKRATGIKRLHLAGKLRLELGSIKLGDAADAAGAAGHLRPGAIGIVAQWIVGAKSSNDDTSHKVPLFRLRLASGGVVMQPDK
jgi:hypothetical protein